MNPQLRTALKDLADVPPPAVSTAAVLAGARRRRRRGLAALTTAAAAVTAAVLAVPTLLPNTPAPAEPAAASPRVVITGYDALSRTAESLGTSVYVPSARRYVTTPWAMAVVSPDRQWVAVTRKPPSDAVGIVRIDRVADPSAVRWLADSVPVIQEWPIWSADGSRLLLPGRNDDLVFSGNEIRVDNAVLVIEPRTAAWRLVHMRFTITRQDVGGGYGGTVSGPRGKGFAFSNAGYLWLFDEQGRLTGRTKAKEVDPRDRPFSPDGRLALVALNERLPSSGVLDVSTGAQVSRASGEPIGWLDDRHYVVSVENSLRVVELRSGRVVKERKLVPDGITLGRVTVAPLSGAAPPGAVVL